MIAQISRWVQGEILGGSFPGTGRTTFPQASFLSAGALRLFLSPMSYVTNTKLPLHHNHTRGSRRVRYAQACNYFPRLREKGSFSYISLYIYFAYMCMYIFIKVKVLVAQSCPTLCDPMDFRLPGKNTGVGCHSLLQGIFLTQGSNLGLLHCR